MDAFLAAAYRHLPEALDWLQRMVAVNSFTTHREGVAELGRLTAECFAGLGFRAEFVPAANPAQGEHLFLSRGDGLPVVLVSHLDTVFPPEEEARQDFRWREEGDRLFGPGTVDNKGGTILIWLMLRVLQELRPERFVATTWCIAANAAEEVIGSDFADRLRQRCSTGARAVLVFEGGPRDADGWHVVAARKGRLEYRLTASGRAAHAGSGFQQGINAVVELAALLPGLAALSDPARDLTVNIATCQGGTVINRVPHEAVAELEIRAFDPAVLAEAGRAVEACAGRSAGGAVLCVERLGHTRAWPGDAATARLVQCWQAAGAELGLPVVVEARGGLSDANYLHDLAPTLDGLGPAGGNAHCSERSADGGKLPEFVERTSFAPKAALNLTALERWLDAC
jgi:glutamate carboxypeptidase